MKNLINLFAYSLVQCLMLLGSSWAIILICVCLLGICNAYVYSLDSMGCFQNLEYYIDWYIHHVHVYHFSSVAACELILLVLIAIKEKFEF